MFCKLFLISFSYRVVCESFFCIFFCYASHFVRAHTHNFPLCWKYILLLFWCFFCSCCVASARFIFVCFFAVLFFVCVASDANKDTIKVPVCAHTLRHIYIYICNNNKHPSPVGMRIDFGQFRERERESRLFFALSLCDCVFRCYRFAYSFAAKINNNNKNLAKEMGKAKHSTKIYIYGFSTIPYHSP